MNNKIIVYENVFNRDKPLESAFHVYLEHPIYFFLHFNKDTSILEEIKNAEDKEYRNSLKRNNLPAMDLSMSNILCIDLDNVRGDDFKMNSVVSKLSKLPTCLCVRKTASNNLCAFFKYSCSTEDYPYLYYKLYLELTILLSTNIDFLPEIGRLRYVTLDEVLYLNKDSETIYDILKVESLPYINTQINKDKARKTIFGSK